MNIQEVLLKRIKKSKFFKRKHTKDQIQKCCNSLQKHGQYQPIIVSEGQILCGNLIYDSIKQLKWKKVKIYELGKLSEQKKKEIRFLDNHTFQLSSWDQNRLKDLLMMLDVKEINDYGFTQEQAYNIINDLNEQEDTKKIKDIKEQLNIPEIYYCSECNKEWTKQELEKYNDSKDQIRTD